MVRYQSAVTSVCVYMGAYYIVPSGGTPIENNKTRKSWLIAYSNTIIVSSAHTRIAFNLYVWKNLFTCTTQASCAAMDINFGLFILGVVVVIICTCCFKSKEGV